MTRVGQILVILLSAFSVLFLAFAIAAVSTPTDWQAKYKAEVAKFDELTAQRAKLQKKIEELSGTITAEVDQHKKDRDTFAEKSKFQEKAYAEQLATLKQGTSDVLKYTAQAKDALDEDTALRKKALDLQEKIQATQQEKEDAMKDRFALEQQRNQLEGSYETISNRREGLKRRADNLSSILNGSAPANDSKEKSKKVIGNPVSKN